MVLADKLKQIAQKAKHELQVYRLVLKDKRTPLLAKVFLGAAVGYLLLPFDLIPDFIPVIGHLDDAIIIPLLVWLGLKFVPKEIVEEYRQRVRAVSNAKPESSPQADEQSSTQNPS